MHKRENLLKRSWEVSPANYSLGPPHMALAGVRATQHYQVPGVVLSYLEVMLL